MFGRLRHLFSDTQEFHLRQPCLPSLKRYEAALKRGWSPNTYEDMSRKTLLELRRDRQSFLDNMVGENLPYQSQGFPISHIYMQTWLMWDNDFVGRIVLRTFGTERGVVPGVSGHVGYSVVPWAQGKRYATRALGLLLTKAHEIGMDSVIIGCDEQNAVSQRIIQRHGGRFVNRIPDPSYRTVMTLTYEVPTKPVTITTD